MKDEHKFSATGEDNATWIIHNTSGPLLTHRVHFVRIARVERVAKSHLVS
jgi:hypothetical protein